MGLAQVQTILARLYTDAETLERFLTDQESFLASLNLEPADAVLFRALSQSQIQQFARSLKRKRLGEVRHLLPLTFQALGKQSFDTLFMQYADTFIPQGTKKHLDDAIKFTEWLKFPPLRGRVSERSKQGWGDNTNFQLSPLSLAGRGSANAVCWGEGQIQQIIDLARYEAMYLESLNPKRQLIFKRFRYPVHKREAALLQITFVLRFRFKRQWRQLAISLPRFSFISHSRSQEKVK